MRYNLQRLAMAASIVALVAACGGGTARVPGCRGDGGRLRRDASADASAASGKEKYTIYLSAVTIGNDWLQQMLRSAQVAVDKGPLAGRVDLKVEQVDGSEQAQINSLNNIIAPSRTRSSSMPTRRRRSTRPSSARATRASSSSATRPVATEPCAYKINTNWEHVTHDLPVWLAKVLGGKGKIIVDRGLPGYPISELSNKSIDNVMAQYPGHRDRRRIRLELRARRRADGRREPARREPADRRHPDRRLRHGRHPGAQGRRPTARARSSCSRTTGRPRRAPRSRASSA